MPYGFRRRKDLQSATAVARHAMPPVVGNPALPFEGRMWICEVPTGGMEAATGQVASKTKCEVKYIAENGQISDMIELGNIANKQTIEVYNPFDLAFPEGELILVHQVGGRPTVMKNFDTGAKVCSFYIQTVIDPATGIGEGVVVEGLSSDAAPNDVIKLYDPIGTWVDLEPDASGIAVSVGEIDDPTNPGTPIDVYVIVYAERRIETYRIKLQENLYGTEAVTVDWNDKQNRAAMPYLQDYPEAAPPIENPLRVDCLANGYVWIRRYWDTSNPYARKWYVHRSENPYADWLQCDITNISGDLFSFTVSGHADGDVPPSVSPINLGALAIYIRPDIGDRILLRFDPNTGGYFWVNDTRYQARWVHGNITIPADTSPNACTQYSLLLSPGCGGLSYWDGYNPGSAVPAWFEGLPFRCDEDQVVEVTAVYRRETQDYKVITTRSATMGNLNGTRKIGVGPIEFECTSEGFCLNQEQVEVPIFSCVESGAPEKEPLVCISSKEFLDCLDICNYICNYCDQIADEFCDPPPPPSECCGDCLFEDALSVAINPGPSITNVTRVSNCCWDIEASDGSTGDVCYNGDSTWSIQLGPPFNFSATVPADPDCAGGGGEVGGRTVSIGATGTDCPDSKCCPYTGDEFIQNFSAENVDGIAFFQLPGATAQLQGGGGGDCGAFASVPIRIEAVGQPGIGCNVVADVRLRYDPDCAGGLGGCVWDVNIPACPDVGSPAEFFTAAEGCTGEQNVAHPCGDAGTPVRWASATFEVVDPDGPVLCTDPVLPGAASARAQRPKRAAVNPLAERPGSMLRRRAPELFAGCASCGPRDAQQLMDAWGCDKTIKEIERLIGEMRRGIEKSTIESVRNLPDVAIEAAIREAVAAERERIARLP